MSKLSIPWQEVSHGVYERGLGFQEQFFGAYLVQPGEKASYGTVGTVTFRSTVPEIASQLLQAWRALRYHCPSIAVETPKGRNVLVYKTATPAVLEAWLEKSFIVHDGDADDTPRQLFANLKRTGYTALHYFPPKNGDEHALVVQADHSNLDGRAHFYLWDRLFTIFSDLNLQKVEFGDEHLRLPLAQDELLDFPTEPLPESDKIAEDWVKGFAVPDPIYIPITSETASKPPTENVIPEVVLSSATTSAVVLACKQRGLTVTQAWHAALSMAIRQIQGAGGSEAGSTMAATSTKDLRPHLTKDGRYDPLAHNMSCYQAGISFSIRSDDGFDNIVQRVREFYTTPWTPARLSALALFGEKLIALFGNGTSAFYTPLFSSLGVLENFVQHTYGSGDRQVQIGDLRSAITSCAPYPMIHLYTWDGRMHCCAYADAAFYPNGELEKCIELTVDILLKELGVPKTE